MIGSDADWLAIVDAIQSAGVGARTWDSALEGFAAATGSRSAQLAGLDASAAVFLNVFTNVDPVLHTVTLAGWIRSIRKCCVHMTFLTFA